MEEKAQKPSFSQRTGELMGDIPQIMGRLNTIIILVILIAITLALCIIEYPYSDGETILEHIMKWE